MFEDDFAVLQLGDGIFGYCCDRWLVDRGDSRWSDNLLDDVDAPEVSNTRYSMNQTRFLLLHSPTSGAGNAMMADVKRASMLDVASALCRDGAWELICHTRHWVTRSPTRLCSKILQWLSFSLNKPRERQNPYSLLSPYYSLGWKNSMYTCLYDR